MSAPHMPMMNGEGLLECPFCSSSYVYCFEYEDGWHAECNQCDSQSGAFLNKKHAVKAWNRRNGHPYTPEDYKQEGHERDYGL